jgi:AcrR family transcriptional regulator
MSTRREQARASRATLLDAARECFATSGYENTTVAAILDRAGMARGALYHYFPGGKREIFIEVWRSVNDEYHVRRAVAGRQASPLDRVRAGMRAFLDQCTTDVFARIALADAPRLVPGQDRLGSSYELLRGQIEQARSDGDIPAVDVDATTMALYGAARAAGEFVVAAADRRAAAAIAADTLDLLVAGLAAKSLPPVPTAR